LFVRTKGGSVDIDKRGETMRKRWEDALTLIFFFGPIGLFGGGQG